mgnify:CR=1 FL=1
MRKISMYTLSAAAAMLVSAAIPVTSLAAVSTYQIPFANGSAYVIGVGGQNCLPGNIGQNGNWGQNGGWGQNNSGNQNNGWGAGPVLPDNSLPQVTPPDFIFRTARTAHCRTIHCRVSRITQVRLPRLRGIRFPVTRITAAARTHLRTQWLNW